MPRLCAAQGAVRASWWRRLWVGDETNTRNYGEHQHHWTGAAQNMAGGWQPHKKFKQNYCMGSLNENVQHVFNAYKGDPRQVVFHADIILLTKCQLRKSDFAGKNGIQ